jgi:hypothetical protein
MTYKQIAYPYRPVIQQPVPVLIIIDIENMRTILGLV